MLQQLETQAERVLVATKEGSFALDYAKIVFIEYCNRTISFAMNDGKHYVTRSIRTTFFSQVQSLLADQRFIRPHQSYVVNLEYVSGISPTSLLLYDAMVIPISKKRRKEIGEQYAAFVKRSGYAQLGVAHTQPIELAEFLGTGLCILEQSADGAVHVRYINQALIDLLLMQQDETGIRALREEDVFASVHPDDREMVISFYHRVLTRDEPISCRCRLRRLDGSYPIVYINVRHVQQEDHHIFYLVYLPTNSFM